MKVFITGVSSGIGRALAKQLVEQGHQVWGVARRQDELQNLERGLASGGFSYSVCDVSDEVQVEGVLNQMGQQSFTPDTVVLNAGVYEPDMERDYDHESGMRAFRINLNGSLVWISKFLPEFKSRGSGQFIAVSSIAAYRPDHLSSAYSASKAALSMAFRSLRLRFMHSGIRFKAIHFGPVDTLVIPRFEQSKKGGWVVSASDAAQYITKVMSSSGHSFFYPLNSWMIRMTRIMPDRIFHALTKNLRR